jgi:hypothetical protein
MGCQFARSLFYYVYSGRRSTYEACYSIEAYQGKANVIITGLSGALSRSQIVSFGEKTN